MQSDFTKTDISDYFPKFTVFKRYSFNSQKKPKVTKHDITEYNIHIFRFLLNNVVWNRFLQSNTSNKTYNSFLKVFFELYDIPFPKKGVVI